MTALDTRLLEWLERWAKARSHDPGPASYRIGEHWSLVFRAGQVLVMYSRDGSGMDEWTLTPLVAWRWAHAVDTGREVRRRCEMCEGERAVIEHVALSADDAKQLDPYPWGKYQAWLARPNKGLGCAAIMREPFPCPTCSTKATYHDTHGKVRNVHEPRGYLDTPLARVVCEGAPRKCHPGSGCRDGKVQHPQGIMQLVPHRRCKGTGFLPGDPTARTELLAAAYGLLVGWTDEQRAFKCEGCRPRAPSDDDLIRVCTSVGGCPSEPPEAARLRDHLEEHGVRVTHERTLAITPERVESSFRKPHGVLGQALALWLSGAPCEAGCSDGTATSTTRDRVKVWAGACKSCHGHGTALAAYMAQQLEQAEVQRDVGRAMFRASARVAGRSVR